MSVGKIFKTLIIIVACVLVGALVLNILLPNVATTLVNSTETMIFKATGMKFDFNADGIMGGTAADNTYSGQQSNGTGDTGNGVVTGFK